MRKSDSPFFFVLFLAVLWACLPWQARAQVQTQPAQTVTAPPRIGVITMGPGDIFWERFGHDAIVVADPALPSPISYNFGYFDLEESDFVTRFLKGSMRYRLMALPLDEDLDYYREVGRGAHLQWLNLSPEQARTLAAALRENAKPENARYHYDYFTDNCATRVRDALDRALGGLLKKQTEGRSSGDTYRSEALRLASPEPWMWVGFDLALGPFADRALTRWQQGFLPRRLADDLRRVKLANGQALVEDEVELLPQRQAAEPMNYRDPFWRWLILGSVLAACVLAAGQRQERVLAAAAGVFWFIGGLLGSVLLLGWAFTEHHAMWANRNLLLLSPLSLLLLPGAWVLLRGRTPSTRFRIVLVIVAALAVLACLPLWLQVNPQRNGHWIALLLPLHAALAWRFSQRTNA